VHLALLGGLTALVLTPVVATGFGGLGPLAKSTKAGKKSSVAHMSKARRGRATLSRNTVASKTRRGAAPSTAALTAGDARAASPDGGSALLADLLQPQDFVASDVQYGATCTDAIIVQGNTATLTQGGNTATGGSATATGGAGGDASTGNTQTNTGTGDTTATSGNATGGAGGDATATGGDAEATNNATQTLINDAC